ncbi:helix-turn-helix transcriptional regulator [Bacillus sp. RO2]|uniref:helix-turn-helix transcriptional regulator n=1 Tax=Bacillus sp. RO2 TaxID=2723913 RepID=UPI00145D21CF|nr:helix-turn-helix transcriptional regulator [Bacillus sp. RO2]NMH73543.1 helix-turn-helix transcriptional regulator [Bacillus sp. RO2]
MRLGSLLKYYRTKLKMTQSDLCDGICSIPHLSKIENNEKEANIDTINLLLNKLNINIVDVKKSEETIKSLLDELIENIIYLQEEKIDITFKELNPYSEFVGFSSYIFIYELYKLRYYLFQKEMDKAYEQIKWLNKQKKNFSQHEEHLFLYFHGVYFILKGSYKEADTILLDLLNNNVDMGIHNGEFFYHLALVKGNLEESGYAILYGKKALQFFTDTHNFKRILHVLMTLGISYTQSSLYDEAFDCFTHLKRNTEILKDTTLLPLVFHNLGLLMRKKGDFSLAIEYYQRGLEHSEENLHYSMVGNYAIGELLFSQNSLQAVERFTKVNNLARKLNNKKYQILSTYFLLDLVKGRKLSIKYLEKRALPFLEKSKENRETFHNFCNILGSYYEEDNNYERAIYYFNKKRSLL